MSKNSPMDKRLRRLDDEEEEEKSVVLREDTLHAKLLDARAVIISEPITARLARSVITQLLILDAANPEAAITVFINSPGGSADSGLAIFDMLRFIRPPVKTVCAGLAASAAALILLAPPKASRFALPNSRIMLHQPSMAFEGTASDIDITARQILKLKEQANRIIAEATGLSLERVTEDTNRDRWLDAPEAVEYGVISRVVSRADEM